MEKEVIIAKLKEILLKILVFIVFAIIYFGLLVIYEMHKIIPFFPILFLFDFIFVVGYPLFLRYILKKKWFECTKDNYLKIKYILLPWLIMEIVFVICYPHEIWQTLEIIAQSNN